MHRVPFGRSQKERSRRLFRTSRYQWIGILTVALAAARAPAAFAEGYEETERRLKSAGIEEPFREEIHEAIRRGVRALITGLSDPGGEFPSRRVEAGHLALASLALRHSGIPDGVRAGKDGLRRLLERERKTVTERTYEAGILGLLLMADGRPHEAGEELHARLARGSTDGYWGYATVGDGSVPNLSTSQFACLGLWSTERLGVPSAPAAWNGHVTALLRAQGADGSWPYHVDPPARPNETYPTGTFMGLADFVLAEHAIAYELAADPARRAAVIVARHRATAALRRHTGWVLSHAGSPSGWEHYQLFALEKVALFLGLESIGGRSWYAEGARRLVDTRNPGSGWGADVRTWRTPSLAGGSVDTSFALLFLLRVSESYRPITPRPVDPPPPTTPGEPLPPEPVPQGPPPALGLDLANAILDRLASFLDAPQEQGFGAALDAVRFVRRTWTTYRPGGVPLGPEHAAWCERAQGLLLRAALDRTERPPRTRGFGQALAFEALEALGETDGAVAPSLLDALEHPRESTTWPATLLSTWRSSALDTLRRVRSPVLPAWLRTRGFGEGVVDWQETSPALVAAAGLGDLGGRERRALVEAALARLAPVLTNRVSDEPWTEGIENDVFVLVRTLSRSPVAAGSMGVGRLRALQEWWADHRAADDPLWDP